MITVRLCLACAGLLAFTTAALAEVPSPGPAARVQDAAGTAKPLSDDDLAGFSGGAAVAAISDQQLTALNSGNTVNAASVVNGNVTLSSNAFSGFSGFGNFVINTGNNNNLQGVMSVNIVMVPAATP